MPWSYCSVSHLTAKGLLIYHSMVKVFGGFDVEARSARCDLFSDVHDTYLEDIWFHSR